MTTLTEINQLISILAAGVQQICKDNLIAIYLTGSLSYGDFQEESSDIDLIVILKEHAGESELAALQILHKEIEKKYPTWAKRVEVSYVPQKMLVHILPPVEPRPYYGEGVFYPAAEYGNEWIINLYLVYTHGMIIYGPPVHEVVPKTEMIEVQLACVRDLFTEWEPKLRDTAWLENSHYQSYLVMNLCRILHTVVRGLALSKLQSSAWVKTVYPQWVELISEAEHWKYGVEMNQPEQTRIGSKTKSTT